MKLIFFCWKKFLKINYFLVFLLLTQSQSDYSQSLTKFFQLLHSSCFLVVVWQYLSAQKKPTIIQTGGDAVIWSDGPYKKRIWIFEVFMYEILIFQYMRLRREPIVEFFFNQKSKDSILFMLKSNKEWLLVISGFNSKFELYSEHYYCK